MVKHIGVDWAGKGWVGVILRDGGWDADLFPSLWSVWKYHSDAARILVDMPIGLPDVRGGRRACDVQAKEILGRRHRSVFYAPIREAVYETNLDAAKAVNEEAGYSIQNQAWGIVPRIREVDEFLDMNPSAQDRLRETHPEVCFRALKGEPLRHVKSTAEGVAERRAIVADELAGAGDIVDAIAATMTRPVYAPMVSGVADILDALVAAVTAQRDASGVATLPAVPPTDERGLAMEIVYPSSTVQTRLSALA